MTRSQSGQNGAADAPKRGRPPKFGRPGHVVSLTLPDDTLQALNRVHPDTGWAIVKLLEREARQGPRADHEPDVTLARIASRRSLIIVNRTAISSLPGVNLIPYNETRAFLAMDAGRGMSDLELAVIDRLSDTSLRVRERAALESLRTQLATWRHDRQLTFHSHSIIIVERSSSPRPRARRAGRRSDRDA